MTEGTSPFCATSAGDFNKPNLKRMMPNLYQHIDCAMRGSRTLDHCYTQFRGEYKAQYLAPVGKSNHAAIFLWPSYVTGTPRDEGSATVDGPIRGQHVSSTA